MTLQLIGKVKVAGFCFIDLEKYLNKNLNGNKETMDLQKCPDKSAKIHFSIHFRVLKEIMEFEP